MDGNLGENYTSRRSSSAAANITQLRNRCLPAPQSIVLEFRTTPIAISSHEGDRWVGAAKDVPRIDDGYANAVQADEPQEPRGI